MSIIVSAIVAGLTSVIESAVRDAAQSGYDALRERLARRYGPGVDASIGRLEEDPRSPELQDEVARELRNAGAAQDPELIRLAQQITDLVDEPELALADPVADIRRAGGLATIRGLLDEHVGLALSVRSHYAVDDHDLLSTRVGRQRALPEVQRSTLAALQLRMRQIIHQIAASIEESRYREVDVALESMGGGLSERQRAALLVQADKDLHVSYETLRLTVEFFSELNHGVLARIEQEPSVRREANMLFGNALLILETTNFVISFVEGFQLSNNVDRLHSEAMGKVHALRRELSEFRDQLTDGSGIDASVRANSLADIENQTAALVALEQEWARYMSEVGQLQSTIGDVRAMLPTLETIRRSAQYQIRTLQLVSMLTFLRHNSESIRGAVASLHGFRLAPLSSSRVRRLLGV